MKNWDPFESGPEFAIETYMISKSVKDSPEYRTIPYMLVLCIWLEGILDLSAKKILADFDNIW